MNIFMTILFFVFACCFPGKQQNMALYRLPLLPIRAAAVTSPPACNILPPSPYYRFIVKAVCKNS